MIISLLLLKSLHSLQLPLAWVWQNRAEEKCRSGSINNSGPPHLSTASVHLAENLYHFNGMGPSELNWSLGQLVTSSFSRDAKDALENDVFVSVSVSVSASASIIEGINSHRFAPGAPTFNHSLSDL